MKNRRFSFGLAGLVVAAVYVNAVACGGDDEDNASPQTDVDASNDVTTSDVSAQDQTAADQQSQDVVSNQDATDGRGQEQTGQSCTSAAQCYGGLDAAALKGAPACLDKVTDGYCTHECTQDSDCCAVPGECRTGLKQVCSSFESSGKKYCFLSCEPEDIANAADAGVDSGATPDGGTSADQYCTTQASPEFGCRSTGGGSANRKVCLPLGAPGDGGPADAASDAADAADADGG